VSELSPAKLYVTFQAGVSAAELQFPRRYTLTHSDTTGDLFLSIGTEYNQKQIRGIYTRLMRDEVLAELKDEQDEISLHVYVHVSGGIILGTAGWRNDLLHHHMPLVLEALRHADKELYFLHPEMENARVLVHFASNHKRYGQTEDWGQIQKYRIEASQDHLRAREGLA
jgi:hypothetical protein